MKVTKLEAIEYLSSGHSLYTIDCAKAICEAVGVEFSDHLIIRWTGQKDANPNNDPKGLFLDEDKPGEGIGSIELSNYVALKLDIPVGQYFGRGTQARRNAEEIKKKLNL